MLLSIHFSLSVPLHFYLIKHIRHVLLAAGLLGVAELRGVLAGQQALISDQRHALIGHLVPFKVHLVVGATCKRETFSENPPKDVQNKCHPLPWTCRTNFHECVLGKNQKCLTAVLQQPWAQGLEHRVCRCHCISSNRPHQRHALSEAGSKTVKPSPTPTQKHTWAPGF